MKHLKTFVIFFFINVVVGLGVPIAFGGDALSHLGSNGAYLRPILIVLLGLLPGYLILLVVGKNKATYAYLMGQLLSCVGCSVILIVNSYDLWQHERYYGNVDNNRDFMEFVNEDEQYIKTAFHELEKNFSDKNEFRLYSFHVCKKDTLIALHQDTIYVVYFSYYLAGGRDNLRISKIQVFKNRPELLYKNADVASTKEYISADKHFYYPEANMPQMIDTFLKDVPADRQKGLKDTIETLLKN